MKFGKEISGTLRLETGRRVAIGCPGGHELEIPARARAGVYGPCPCGWTLALQAPVGVSLGRLARLLGYSSSEVRKLAREGGVRTTRPPRPGSHRRVPADEVARLMVEAGGNRHN